MARTARLLMLLGRPAAGCRKPRDLNGVSGGLEDLTTGGCTNGANRAPSPKACLDMLC
jgi:hypothetical protein